MSIRGLLITDIKILPASIFIEVGKSIRKGYTTQRVIREVDVTPTVAVLLGVRMTWKCEDALVYQILDI